MERTSSHPRAIMGVFMLIATFFLSLTIFTGCERPCEETGTCSPAGEQVGNGPQSVAILVLVDKDNDGFAGAATEQAACDALNEELKTDCQKLFGKATSQLTGGLAQVSFALKVGDCDDNDPLTYPGAVEVIDGKDNNCDGQPMPGEILNGVSCDDGDVCTTGDVGVDGICVGTDTSDCNDSNPCTDDSCNPETGCVYTNDDTNVCADADLCDGTETCVSGVCTDGTALICNDSNPCTDDSCDPATGCVYTNDDTNVCADADLCDGTETCVSGICTDGTTLTCDDLNLCTDDSCNPETGCVYTNDDTNVCADADLCDGTETCVSGVCTDGTALICNDSNVCTDDNCEPAIGCVHTNNFIICEDGNQCTGEDQCVDGKCEAGPPVDCNDSDTCTNDSCDPILGCQHTPIVCNDNDDCTADSCNPATGCVFVPIPACCLDDADCAGSVPVFVPPFVLQPGGYWNNGTYSYGCLPNLDPEISTGICTVCEDDDNDGWCNSTEKKCEDDIDGDWDGETDCDDGDCEDDPVCFACDIGNPCPQGYYCVDGHCTEFTDQHESTPAGQGGAGGGPFPDGTPDNWDDDGDGYCGVAPCLGSANPTIPIGNLLGGDCDDDPLDGATFIIYTGKGSFVTDGSYYNHPAAFEWPDNYDNDCDGTVDG